MTVDAARPTIRPATADDADAFGAFLREVWLRAGPAADGFAGATDEVIDELARPDEARARIVAPGQRVFLAVRASGIVGFAVVRRVGGETSELAGIVVSEPEAGRGIGSQLLGAVVAWVRDDGGRRLRVRTETSNLRAIGFYRSHGFGSERRTVESVDGTDVPVVELSLDLALAAERSRGAAP